MSDTYEYDWRTVWNMGVYAFHSLLTGHKSGIDIPSGKVRCLTEKPDAGRGSDG